MGSDAPPTIDSEEDLARGRLVREEARREEDAERREGLAPRAEHAESAGRIPERALRKRGHHDGDGGVRDCLQRIGSPGCVRADEGGLRVGGRRERHGVGVDGAVPRLETPAVCASLHCLDGAPEPHSIAEALGHPFSELAGAAPERREVTARRAATAELHHRAEETPVLSLELGHPREMRRRARAPRDPPRRRQRPSVPPGDRRRPVPGGAA